MKNKSTLSRVFSWKFAKMFNPFVSNALEKPFFKRQRKDALGMDGLRQDSAD